MTNVVITGANRGIGLALATLYQQRGATIYGVCRTASPELNKLGVNVIDQVDVCTEAGLTSLKASLTKVSIDILINNAGILFSENLQSLNKETITQQFQTNAVAPLLVTEALLDNLNEKSKVALITSRMGSIADNSGGGYYGYRMSKAALNAAGMSLARDLAPKKIAVALLHPGFVQTDMVGGRGEITPLQAATGLVARIDELTLETTGGFWHSNGEELPW